VCFAGDDANEEVVNRFLDCYEAELPWVIVASAREWYLVLANKKAPLTHEAPYVESALVSGD
jgi:hypothetical protein